MQSFSLLGVCGKKSGPPRAKWVGERLFTYQMSFFPIYEAMVVVHFHVCWGFQQLLGRQGQGEQYVPWVLPGLWQWEAKENVRAKIFP